MKNWRTTFGGALSALGSTLAGISTIGAFMEPDYRKMAMYFIATGVVCSALGKFFGLLWAVDTKNENS